MKLLRHPSSHLVSGGEASWSSLLLPFLIWIGLYVVPVKQSCAAWGYRQGYTGHLHCPTLLSISFTWDFWPQLLMKVLWRIYTSLNPLQLLTGASRYKERKKKLHIPADCKICFLTVFKIFYASHKATRFYFWFPPSPNLLMEKINIWYPVKLTLITLFLKTELCSRLNSPHNHLMRYHPYSADKF